MLGRMSGFSSVRYDFARPTEPNRAYIVASSYRSGSTHLCRCLWETGVMGAPWEYLNFENEMRAMWGRLGAKGPADYLAKLLAHRTSSNGVFGMKAHFHHFEAALRTFPQLLEAMPPVRFVYIDRKDKVAQAVSMAKAIQTSAWLSLITARRSPLFYSDEFITACLDEVESQTCGWAKWFEITKTEPFVVRYEDLLSDRAAVVKNIVRFLGAERDAADTVVLPEVRRQADQVSAEWIRRYRGGSREQRKVA